jgi:hypothetical protein
LIVEIIVIKAIYLQWQNYSQESQLIPSSVVVVPALFAQSQKNSMIHGVVSRNREATISLVIVNESRQTKLITAVIDTGYTGFLSLPSEIISELNLSWTGIDRGTLGDGSEVTFEVYAAKVKSMTVRQPRYSKEEFAQRGSQSP